MYTSPWDPLVQTNAVKTTGSTDRAASVSRRTYDSRPVYSSAKTSSAATRTTTASSTTLLATTAVRVAGTSVLASVLPVHSTCAPRRTASGVPPRASRLRHATVAATLDTPVAATSAIW